jgi:hypothetical protein
MAYRASDRGAADDDTANPPYLFRGERLAHRHALALANPAQVGMEIVAMHGAQRSVVNT